MIHPARRIDDINAGRWHGLPRHRSDFPKQTPFIKMNAMTRQPTEGYRGRVAPTPSGYLHMGHGATFWEAQERVRARDGILVFRMEDLDPVRSTPHFIQAALEDLRWFGLRWDEGPEEGGAYGPYLQSARTGRYRAVLEQLIEQRWVYPCFCSRKDIQSAAVAPHVGDEGPIYPGTCCHRPTGPIPAGSRRPCWRMKVPRGRKIGFVDGRHGAVSYTAGVDFGDFVVWRQDDVASYQLAVTVDDHFMGITEVVRGEDLLVSTCRQLLLYEAMGWKPPRFVHCPLLRNREGERIAKRANALSLRDYRDGGWTPRKLRDAVGAEGKSPSLELG